MDQIELDHVTQVIAYHPSYLEHFLKIQTFIMYADGPLPNEYRHYLAIIAAARHQCVYLVNLHKKEFLDQNGDPNWLNGLDFIPPKLRAIYNINKILAHRPWLLTKEHIERLTKGPNNWSLSELVHAIVLLSHFHSLSSFVFSCGLTQELDPTSNQKYSKNVQKPSDISSPPNRFRSSLIGQRRQEVSVDALMQRMRSLSLKQDECSETELNDRFKTVEIQAHELPDTIKELIIEIPENINHFIDDPLFTYQEFTRRGVENVPGTFRVQDYSWDDHGFSLVNRLYNDVGDLLDLKFRSAYNLTYFTMADKTNVDTSKFRRAIWNYIQCIYGIRHDDYDYGEVNQLLERSLKIFIKTACCFPERITKKDYDSILTELKHSEKVHINLMILEARNQAELLYSLREIMRYMT
ncbi:sestrin homolog [Contarinia nasturtii]|uniref:sestrin homolog n=1 Tax=Contarinia nasturtii TaxID=265458 RepID=UPI0012D45DCD|nr:sestrin homolog [Contarinia nasturtii]XP_031638143.1 sestrin homolog [Contarinia nasturtii]